MIKWVINPEYLATLVSWYFSTTQTKKKKKKERKKHLTLEKPHKRDSSLQIFRGPPEDLRPREQGLSRQKGKVLLARLSTASILDWGRTRF